MNKERLLKLAGELENNSNGRVMQLPKRGHAHFRLADWGHVSGCGTAACACGYATLHPWFQRRGFTHDRHTLVPIYGGVSSWDAVDAFFGLARDCSRSLFDYSSYPKQGRDPTPKQVAKRIRKFVADHA